jgi:F0F1-type ATP synthase membrane subunit b/b'
LHWTHSEIIELLKAATPFIAAIGTLFSAVNAWQIKRARDRVKEAITKVDEVHACLADARMETAQAIEEVKQQATVIAQDATDQRRTSG